MQLLVPKASQKKERAHWFFPANTYEGDTVVTAGTLKFSDAAGLGKPGEGIVKINGGTVEATAAMTIAPKKAGVSGFEMNAGTLIFADGGASKLQTGLKLTNNTNVINSGNNVTIETTKITGTGGFEKKGTGELILKTANDYEGNTTITDGKLTIQNATGLGAAGKGVLTIGTGKELLVFGDFDIATKGGATVVGAGGKLTFADSGVAINKILNTLDLAGNFIVDINHVFKIELDTVNGVGGAITKNGTGELILSGGNDYTGNTTIAAGTLTVKNNTSLGRAGTGQAAIGANKLKFLLTTSPLQLRKELLAMVLIKSPSPKMVRLLLLETTMLFSKHQSA